MIDKDPKPNIPTVRLLLGGAIFIFGLLSPLSIPLLTASDLPLGWKATLSGLLMFGIPELFLIIAVAVMGKPGYNFFKEKIFGIFSRIAPPDTVNQTRYRVGLIMFVLPLLYGWLEPYLAPVIPNYQQNHLIFNIAGDIILVISFFVLGGDFWDKLRALFIYGSKAQ